MNARIVIFIMLMGFLASCSKPVSVTVTNPLDEPVNELVTGITAPEIIQAAETLKSFKLMAGTTEVPYQVIKDGDQIGSILVQLDLEAGATKTLTLKKAEPAVFPKKTQAEISIKEGGVWEWVKKKNGNEQYEYIGGTWKHVNSLWVDEKHTDHSFDIRYEGPGWESDKIGYRFYLDWRNATDIFGKKVDTMVLQQVGLDGFDSYHEMSDWGADILKVGKALGIGTIAHWADGQANRVAKTDSLYSEVTLNGNLESQVTTLYKGWEFADGKTDLTSVLTIRGGSHLTKCELTSSNPIDSLATGIITLPDTEVFQSPEGDGEWAYFGTFGVQSLNKDHLGMFIFYKKDQLELLTQDKLNHVIVMKPENQKVTYYFGGAWELDASQMNTAAKFETFLNHQLALLNSGLID
ncbi:DUF4861 family protein [Mangrovibacterium lignilyticum]|uniref:DUF4861 family protein n=1 Tax=Mangrovibacterium lignilyticum TaxID=2668052 RepID=UPI0013D20534|nr:DUF4861 family protein [Mangrovibacterium lignilyticum]